MNLSNIKGSSAIADTATMRTRVLSGAETDKTTLMNNPANAEVASVKAPVSAVRIASLGQATFPATAVQPSAVGIAGLNMGNVSIKPMIPTTPPLSVLPFVIPQTQQIPEEKTATQLSNGAIDHINHANVELVKDAINYITTAIKNSNRDFPSGAGSLVDYLERKTKIRLVLNMLANGWDDVTRSDFEDAFRMPHSPNEKLDVMDIIVSISILNEKTLQEQLTTENTPRTTEQDLRENHKIVHQYPPAGTPLQPPYVILVAVEYQELAKAEEIVKSILGQLEDYQGLKIPKATVRKLAPSLAGVGGTLGSNVLRSK